RGSDPIRVYRSSTRRFIVLVTNLWVIREPYRRTRTSAEQPVGYDEPQEATMGTRGPVPKRDDERKRTNERPMETTRAVGAAAVKQPRGDGDWHPIVKKLWKAMGESGQSQFYEPSDWAVAYSVMDDLSDYKRQARRSPAMLQVIMSSVSNLLVT